MAKRERAKVVALGWEPAPPDLNCDWCDERAKSVTRLRFTGEDGPLFERFRTCLTHARALTGNPRRQLEALKPKG